MLKQQQMICATTMLNHPLLGKFIASAALTDSEFQSQYTKEQETMSLERTYSSRMEGRGESEKGGNAISQNYSNNTKNLKIQYNGIESCEKGGPVHMTPPPPPPLPPPPILVVNKNKEEYKKNKNHEVVESKIDGVNVINQLPMEHMMKNGMNLKDDQNMGINNEYVEMRDYRYYRKNLNMNVHGQQQQQHRNDKRFFENEENMKFREDNAMMMPPPPGINYFIKKLNYYNWNLGFVPMNDEFNVVPPLPMAQMDRYGQFNNRGNMMSNTYQENMHYYKGHNSGNNMYGRGGGGGGGIESHHPMFMINYNRYGDGMMSMERREEEKEFGYRSEEKYYGGHRNGGNMMKKHEKGRGGRKRGYNNRDNDGGNQNMKYIRDR